MNEGEVINTQLEDFNKTLSELLAIANDKVKRPSVPTEIAIQEAEDLYAIAKRYEDELTEVGLTTEMIDSLMTRAGVLRVAQSRWRMNYNSFQDPVKDWKDARAEAQELQERLKNTFRYAYRNEERLMTRVREIGLGQNDQDMIQDINDFVTLGLDYPTYLEAVKFDVSELDKIANKSREFARLLADSKAERKLQHDHKDIRDRAFTFLKDVVDETRACAKYVFAEHPAVVKRFLSSYRSRKRRSKEEENNTETKETAKVPSENIPKDNEVKKD
ncbi:MAG: hypothetical protein ACEPOV_04010 [Hyphomicrobiales bacterium]